MPAKDVDAYISDFPQEVQALLCEIRSVVQKAAPSARELIKYSMPTFVYGENLVHFAAHKKLIGFYPTPSAIREFASDIKSYKNAKGSVRFPIDQPMPLDLIQRMVQFRVREIDGKNSEDR